jgi:hypothetical protein
MVQPGEPTGLPGTAAPADPLEPLNQPETIEQAEPVDSAELIEPAAEVPVDATAGASGICDIPACAAKYNSFDASDCTFQPFGGGPRQLCEIAPGTGGAPPPEAGDAPPPEAEIVFEGEPIVIEEGSAEGGASGACDVAACAAAYSSFNPADCTYQPFGGWPRRLCEK